MTVAFIGCHLSTTKGYRAMGETAVAIGADTFAFFPRPPRGGAMRALDREDIEGLQKIMDEHAFGPLVAHAPYVYNLAAAKPEIVERTRANMVEDIERLEVLGNCLYNFHPGAHVGQGAEHGIAAVAEGLNAVIDPGQATVVLLETMAGKGTELGRSFEELAAVIDAVDAKDKVGVCLDTCHISDGGYDIAANLDAVLDEFDSVVGLDRLRALHLNDSMNPVGSHKDRHERLGEGTLGLGLFEAVVRSPRLADLPMILETPNDVAGYKAEIAVLRSAMGEGPWQS